MFLAGNNNCFVDSLDGNRIGDEGVHELVEGIVKLHMFRLSDDQKVSEDELKVSRKFQSAFVLILQM